jgi:hypothetical protein
VPSAASHAFLPRRRPPPRRGAEERIRIPSHDAASARISPRHHKCALKAPRNDRPSAPWILGSWLLLRAFPCTAGRIMRAPVPPASERARLSLAAAASSHIASLLLLCVLPGAVLQDASSFILFFLSNDRNTLTSLFPKLQILGTEKDS